MLSYKDFFQFGSNFAPTKYHACLFGSNDKPGAEIKLLIGEYEGFEFPITFKHEYQHKALDILETGTPYLYLISERMKFILDQNKLTGWQLFPIKLLDNKGNAISGYYGFSVYGKCGQIDYRKCSVVERTYIENGPSVKEYIGFPIDLEKWDRTDFFLPESNFGIIITQKAAIVLKENRITNLSLTCLTDVVTPEFALKNRDLN